MASPDTRLFMSALYEAKTGRKHVSSFLFFVSFHVSLIDIKIKIPAVPRSRELI